MGLSFSRPVKGYYSLEHKQIVRENAHADVWQPDKGKREM